MKLTLVFGRLSWLLALLGGVAAGRAAIDPQPFEYAKGSLNEQEDRPDTPKTGQVVLALAGDSTVTYMQVMRRGCARTATSSSRSSTARAADARR